MRTHYVPAHYLRGFSSLDAQRFIVWAFDKTTGRGFPTQPENLALETDFYPQEVEIYLANLIEEPSRLILDRIREQHVFEGPDKDEFSRYIIAMIRRVPRHRERLYTEVLPDAMTNTLKAWRDLIQSERDCGRLSQDMYAFRMREMDELDEKWSQEPPDDLKPENRQPEVSPEVVALLASMHWTFVTTEGPSRFLTSDNPVFFTEGRGMNKPDSELMFPLSSDIALWVKRCPISRDCEFSRAKQFLVREANKRTIMGATRFVYYHESASWIPKLFAKRRLQPQKLSGQDTGLFKDRHI